MIMALKCCKCNESYLCNRKQQMSLNYCLSDASDVIRGFPQGSILGPLLFLISINRLPLHLQNNVCTTDLYADDTT